MNDLMSAAEAAERRGVSVATIYKAAREGRINTVRFMGRVGFRVADVDAWQPGPRGGARPNTGRRYRKAASAES